MNSVCKIISLVVALVVSKGGFALPQKNEEDCISINYLVTNAASVAEKGRYRQTLAITDEFDFSTQGAFSEYIAHQRKKIFAENPKAHLPCPITTPISDQLYGGRDLKVIDLIAPFQVDPRMQAKSNTEKKHDTRGVLLIHGLTDSPFIFHDLASSFLKQGITVRTLLLPGHGTAASALVDVSHAQWRAATAYGVQSMLEDFDTVYLGGFSTGGALLIDYLNQQKISLAQEEQIKGLMLWSPASQAKANMAWAAQYVAWFKDYIDEGTDIDFAKYESFPFNAAAQIYSLMQHIQPANLTDTPDIPLFVVASEVDQTIDTKSTLRVLEHWHNNGMRKTQHKDTLIYYADKAQKPVLSSSINVIKPELCTHGDYCEALIGIAHTALTNAPNNQHYGWQGIYRNCEHVFGTAYYRTCKTTQNPILGETTAHALQAYPAMQRLTFNPYFDHMVDALARFLDSQQRD